MLAAVPLGSCRFMQFGPRFSILLLSSAQRGEFMRLGSMVGMWRAPGEDEDRGELIVPCVIPERFWL